MSWTRALSLGVAGLLAVAPLAAAQYDVVTVTLPAGEPAAGRRAFVDLKCTACHLVVGETGLASPISESRGPDLDHSIACRSASDLAAAIIAPSHSMSVRTSEALKKQLAELSVSPMGDFSRAMSVRQLADLLAYLGSLNRTK